MVFYFLFVDLCCVGLRLQLIASIYCFILLLLLFRSWTVSDIPTAAPPTRSNYVFKSSACINTRLDCKKHVIKKIHEPIERYNLQTKF